MKKQHGTKPCPDTKPHAAHRFDRRSWTWGCLGVRREVPA